VSLECDEIRPQSLVLTICYNTFNIVFCLSPGLAEVSICLPASSLVKEILICWVKLEGAARGNGRKRQLRFRSYDGRIIASMPG
jgi:hypothetical protein